MNIEHLARGSYIICLGDNEFHELRKIACIFHSGNIAASIRHILSQGIKVYNEILQSEYENDQQFKDSFKILAKELFDIELDKYSKKFGSAISSND